MNYRRMQSYRVPNLILIYSAEGTIGTKKMNCTLNNNNYILVPYRLKIVIEDFYCK